MCTAAGLCGKNPYSSSRAYHPAIGASRALSVSVLGLVPRTECSARQRPGRGCDGGTGLCERALGPSGEGDLEADP